jgi:hypothetical protein
MTPQQIRQGDVQLQPVPALPAGCTEVPPSGNRIVLALGEVTGHAHAIYDHAAIGGIVGRAQDKARLWSAANGERYLEVTQPVTLRHEEHTAHTLPPGIYWLPRQVEYTGRAVRRVAD